MRNNALLFFGGIATATVVQFVTQRDWRASPANEIQASEMAYSANGDGDRNDARFDESRSTRDRRRIRESADGPVRQRGRAESYGKRDDERNEERGIGWSDDGRNEEGMIERRGPGDRAERDQSQWRYAAEERPARDSNWQDGGEGSATRRDRAPDREIAWESGPGPRGAHRRGAGSGGGGSKSESFNVERLGFGRRSGSGGMRGPGGDGPAFARRQLRGGHFGSGGWSQPRGWGGGERFTGGHRFEFVRHGHHRGHHRHGWAGRGHTRGRASHGWASHRGGRSHHGWQHERGHGRSFARHSMRGHHRFGHHGFARHGFARHRFGQHGIARHDHFARHGHVHHRLGQRRLGRGRFSAFHNRGEWGPSGHPGAGRAGLARLAKHRADARLDALFAAADTNKDGKLTKDELANFLWKRFAKPDAQSVTKEEVKSFIKQRITALRAERPSGRRHKPHGGTGASKKEDAKPGGAQPKPAPASSPKAEPKAEANPVAAPATAAAQPSPTSKPAGSTQPAVSKSGQANQPLHKPAGVSKSEAAQPASPKNSGSKIGTSTTSGDVKAALFAARR